MSDGPRPETIVSTVLSGVIEALRANPIEEVGPIVAFGAGIALLAGLVPLHVAALTWGLAYAVTMLSGSSTVDVRETGHEFVKNELTTRAECEVCGDDKFVKNILAHDVYRLVGYEIVRVKKVDRTICDECENMEVEEVVEDAESESEPTRTEKETETVRLTG